MAKRNYTKITGRGTAKEKYLNRGKGIFQIFTQCPLSVIKCKQPLLLKQYK